MTELNIYEGCYVELRNGEVVGPIKQHNDHDLVWADTAAASHCWRKFGGKVLHTRRDHPKDIVRVLTEQDFHGFTIAKNKECGTIAKPGIPEHVLQAARDAGMRSVPTYDLFVQAVVEAAFEAAGNRVDLFGTITEKQIKKLRLNAEYPRGPVLMSFAFHDPALTASITKTGRQVLRDLENESAPEKAPSGKTEGGLSGRRPNLVDPKQGGEPMQFRHRYERKRRMNTRPVLDACCGSRMFWFDRADDRAVFGDIRSERHELTDRSSAGGSRSLIIEPDQVIDFRALPFQDHHFHLVAFDPPHLIQNGSNGWLAKKYGKLGADWRDDLRAGFAECFRVLRPLGTLIFKWNEHEVKVSEILKLTDQKPLFGNRCGKNAKSHWIVFMKPDGDVASISKGGAE